MIELTAADEISFFYFDRGGQVRFNGFFQSSRAAYTKFLMRAPIRWQDKKAHGWYRTK